MSRESLVRRLPELAFAVLFGGGLILGGGAALAGIPRLLDVLPGIAAQAGAEPARDVVRFALPAQFLNVDDSGHAPHVLYPVRASPLPHWLTQAIGEVRSGPPPALRGVHEVAPVRARPVIAICIDDLGEDLAGTDKAMALPQNVALSFLPFADSTPFLAEAAARKGHLVLAHVPMEALGA